MKTTIQLDNNNELLKQLEQVQHDINAHLTLLGYLINSNSIKSDAFYEYEKQYLELHQTYDNLKAQFEREVIRSQFKDAEVFNWDVDFNTKVVTIKW